MYGPVQADSASTAVAVCRAAGIPLRLATTATVDRPPGMNGLPSQTLVHNSLAASWNAFTAACWPSIWIPSVR
ncbi:transglutaminase domain-containing protein [Streptomyces mutabilis]|uniref:transglutaminase domain-containing protein n=1 Tax=Streptomyces mutabilis TaxID=67332 RepID=UPI003A4C7D5C